MFSEIYYLIRSRKDGKYLVARLSNSGTEEKNQYLLVFRENHDAKTYLNTHATNLSDQFSVESLGTNQLKKLLDRWGFQGIGIVADPLEPQIQFLSY